MVRPSRVAAIQSPSGTRTPEVVPFQVKTTSVDGVDLVEVGKLAIIGARTIVASSLSCLTDVGHPAFAEALPGEHRHRPGAEHGPHRHLDRAGVGGGNDADAVAWRDAQHMPGQVDRMRQPRLAELRAVRAAERADGELRRRPARRLGAGTGREIGACGAGFGFFTARKRAGAGRLNHRHFSLSSQRARAALGRRGPLAYVRPRRLLSTEEVSPAAAGRFSTLAA